MKRKRLSHDHSPALAGELVEAAKRYHALGLNLLPVGIDVKTGEHKKPLVTKWTPYQKTPMPLAELVDALGRPDATGIAMISGSTSGGLYVRDFDQPGAFDRWANAEADLADVLPMESTGRRDGRHVFFRSVEAIKTRSFDDGEIRGKNALTIIAPSLHASGKRYT